MRTVLAVCLAGVLVAACASTPKQPPSVSPSPSKPAAAAGGAPAASPPAAGSTARRTATPPPANATTSNDQAPEAPQSATDRPDRPGAQAAPAEPKPYDKVITKDAKTTPGVFAVHRVKEKVYYEIPRKELGKDFLWVSQIARTTLGAGYGGQAAGNRVVRWERKDNRVLLRSVSYEMVADAKLPIARAVQAANNDTILMAFNVEAVGKDEAPVIEVSKLFTTEVTEFSARTRLGARGFDAARSFVERVSSFPENIEVEATHTYTAPPDSGSPTARPEPSPFAPPTMRPGSATVVMHYSMVKLPEKPMQPRLFDERVGYFSVRQQDFGQDEHRAPKRTYITRWRLEKKDPAAAVSEPVKPITYYIDPATPAKWAKWVKKGIEDWQPAFEQAGFKRAIVAADPPTSEQDPNWSPEDARYSVVRWLPSTIENAMGPHIHDPRTGEILESDIQIYHNVMNLARDWYFVQAGPLDPRAKTLPLPDDLMGRLVEYVVAHEVGHTLGFQHNFKASSMYPVEKVRDPEWLRKMGHVPSIMDYSRFNYVAQPEDKIDPDLLVPGLGPYDFWATKWGYAPIAGAATPDAEKKTLGLWAREQDQTPWFRFNTDGAMGVDPGEQSEAVGDADAVQASTLGMKNLCRVMDMLLPATTRAGEPWEDLAEVYGRALGQWTLEMNHVTTIVGGFDSRQRHAGQEGLRFEPVPRARQAAAMKFLNDNAFTTPTFFLKPEILRRIGPSGVLDQVKASQRRVLASLLSPPRFGRLVEQEAFDPKTSYRPTEFMTDLRKGIWAEIAAPRIAIDPYRRNLQRVYLEILGDRLNGRQPLTDDQRPIIRGELSELDRALKAVTNTPKVANRETALHLADARDQIAKMLDPKFAAPAPAPGGATGRPGVDDEAWPAGADTCWPDYIIRPPKIH